MPAGNGLAFRMKRVHRANWQSDYGSFRGLRIKEAVILASFYLEIVTMEFYKKYVIRLIS